LATGNVWFLHPVSFWIPASDSIDSKFGAGQTAQVSAADFGDASVETLALRNPIFDPICDAIILVRLIPNSAESEIIQLVQKELSDAIWAHNDMVRKNVRPKRMKLVTLTTENSCANHFGAQLSPTHQL